MTLLAVSPNIDTPSLTLTDLPSRAAGRDRDPGNQAAAPTGELCLRCGGLLVPGDTSHSERDTAGKPMTVWRCVNCGDCVDHHILVNRGKSSGSARVRARPPTGPQQIGRPLGRKQA